ncbi:MAG: ATP synthase F0 subunit B [Acidobacteriia bacterium]|nr:ATP synthase F0 subunit B [Terriglobia bacterium]
MGDIFSRLGYLFVQSAPTAVFVFLLLVILDRLFFRRLTEVLNEREARTAGALERAREQAALAETRAREYEAAFQAVRQEVYRQRESERRKVLLEREEALRKARQESESRLAQMQAGLAAEVERAKGELGVASEGLALEITRTVLGDWADYPAGGAR